MPARVKRGWRICLACTRAKALARKRGVPFTQELSDEKYAEIIASGEVDRG